MCKPTSMVLQVLSDLALNTPVVIKPNHVSTNTTFKWKCGFMQFFTCSALLNVNTVSAGDQNKRLWSDSSEAADLCFCQTPTDRGDEEK